MNAEKNRLNSIDATNFNQQYQIAMNGLLYSFSATFKLSQYRQKLLICYGCRFRFYMSKLATNS